MDLVLKKLRIELYNLGVLDLFHDIKRLWKVFLAISGRESFLCKRIDQTYILNPPDLIIYFILQNTGLNNLMLGPMR